MEMTYNQILLAVVVIFSLAGLLSPFVWSLYLLLRLPFVWKASFEQAILSKESHGTGAPLSVLDTIKTADVRLNGSVPTRLHYIYLDNTDPSQPEIQAARTACLNQNPNWTIFIWDSSNSRYLVKNFYPHILSTWDNYPYLEQRVDALRYMILYTYGGALLDLRYICRYSLEPLRQFDFVAPAAIPFGISSSMMLASPNNSYVRDLVRYLPIFNHRWLFQSRFTAFFSTGDYYASYVAQVPWMFSGAQKYN